jgi:hypothetical protein
VKTSIVLLAVLTLLRLRAYVKLRLQAFQMNLHTTQGRPCR